MLTLLKIDAINRYIGALRLDARDIHISLMETRISTICHISFSNNDKDPVVAIVQPLTGIFKIS